MAHLDSIEARINERSASSAPGDDLLRPDAPAGFATQGDELKSELDWGVDFGLIGKLYEGFCCQRTPAAASL